MYTIAHRMAAASTLRQTRGYLPSHRESPLFGRYEIIGPTACFVVETQKCEQFAQGCYLKAERPAIEPTTCESIL